MRAARSILPGLFHIPSGHAPKPVTSSGRAESSRPKFTSQNIGVLFGALFFAGYLAGIFKGRIGDSAFGTLLAAHYMDGSHYTSFAALFLDLFSGAFLQAILLFLCGFSAVGSLFLSLYFLARGAVLGLCAAGVYVQGGPRSLVIHWLLTCLPDLGIFLVMLWLSVQANRCACILFRAMLCSGGGHLRRSSEVHQLVIRFLVALFLSAGCCLLGSASGVIFAGVLL